jgi:ribokinase
VRLAPVQASARRVAVVGHVEWVQFARVARLPRAGELIHAGEEFEEPAGGGAVAAVQLARLAGESVLFTALGDDEHGRRALRRLNELGVEVHAAILDAPTRRATTLVDGAGERTITTFGARLEPSAAGDERGWSALAGMDAVYFTAGDLAALQLARAGARVLVASPRAGEVLGHGVPLDALVASGEDELERREAARAQGHAELLAFSEGEHGGSYSLRSGESGRWMPAPLAGERVDSYGCGDSFAAGLAYGLGAGLGAVRALELGARCGAACAAGRGPYGRQLSGRELEDEN